MFNNKGSTDRVMHRVLSNMSLLEPVIGKGKRIGKETEKMDRKRDRKKVRE